MDPLILTLALDAGSFARLDALRRAHFPPERNFLSAHVTLFHALPGAEEGAILARLGQAAGRGPAAIRVGPPMSLGRGVALRVEAPEVAALRKGLARDWEAWLTPQDRQGWRGHATVQNKVPTDAARRLLAELADLAWDGTATGLLLWRYRGGPWEAVAELPFRG